MITPVEAATEHYEGACVHGSWYLGALTGTTVPATSEGVSAAVVPVAIAPGSNPLSPTSAFAIHVAGSGQENGPDTFAYASLNATFNNPSAQQVGTVDASAYTGIQFLAKITAGASGVRVSVGNLFTDPSGGMCSPAGGPTGCYDNPGIAVPTSASWALYRVAFADLRQLGFGLASPTGDAFPKGDIVGVRWDIQVPARGPTEPWDLTIDELAFY